MGTWIVLGVVIVAAIAALVFICKNGGWGGCGGDCAHCAGCDAQKKQQNGQYPPVHKPAGALAPAGFFVAFSSSIGVHL